MPTDDIGVVFFDIGNTLATAEFTADNRLKRLRVLPGVLPVLEALRQRQLRMGVISNTPLQQTHKQLLKILNQSGLGQFFESSLCIFSSAVGFAKPDAQIYRLALLRAGQTATPGR